jgi:hypothetical protein
MSFKIGVQRLLKHPATVVAIAGLAAASLSKPSLNAGATTDLNSFRRNKSVRYEHLHSQFHARFSAAYPNLMVMPMTPQLIALHTIIRKLTDKTVLEP